MESPAYLLDQFAKSHGLSANGAKRGLMLKAFASEGMTIEEASSKIGIFAYAAKRIARKVDDRLS